MFWQCLSPQVIKRLLNEAQLDTSSIRVVYCLVMYVCSLGKLQILSGERHS